MQHGSPSDADARIEKARRLAISAEDFESLVRGEGVPLSRLNPKWARHYGYLCSKLLYDSRAIRERIQSPNYCDRPAERDSFHAYWRQDGWRPRLCRKHWYEEYLNSSRWERVRERKLRDAGRKCERCGDRGYRTLKGNPAGLQVHHRTYERVGGDERMEDLEVLCEDCHREEHGR